MSSFSERLQLIRSDLGISQKEMAEKIEIPYGTFRRYENGGTDPPREVLARISELGNYDMNWLLTGKGQMIFQETTIETDPDFQEYAAGEAGDPGLQQLLSDGNRKKYGITDEEAQTLRSILFRRDRKSVV